MQQGTIRGPAGPKGDKGDPGTSVTIKGSVPTAADLPSSASEGDGWITANDGHLHVWTGGAGSMQEASLARLDQPGLLDRPDRRVE